MDNITGDYMTMTTNDQSLSEEEMDAQLGGGKDFTGLTRGQTGRDTDGNFSVNLNDAMAKAFVAAEMALERSEAVDAAVKAAANGVKILAPILEAVTLHKASPQEATRILTKALIRVATDTKLVLEKGYGLSESEAPVWLTATVSGQLIKIITNSLREGNTAILDQPSNDYIQPLIDALKQVDHISPPTHPTASTQMTIANELMMATCAVMAEYQCFNYFQSDPSLMAQNVSNFLNDRVIRGSIDELTARFQLTPNEQSYFATSLLSSAGSMLANVWRSNIADTIAEVKQLPTEARQNIAANGYLINNILERFEKNYMALELSCENAIRTLNPERERFNQNAAPTRGHGIG